MAAAAQGPQSARDGAHRAARINYRIRAAAFAYSFLVLGLHGFERGFGGLFWLLLALQFLAYPHLLYLRTRYARDSRKAEETNLYIDSAALGAWVAALHFPAWIAYAALFSTTLNATVLRGIAGAGWSLGCFAAGVLVGIAGGGIAWGAPTSLAVTVLCFVGSLGYTCSVGWVVYQQNRRLAAARDALRRGEERYRLIAENAGDLIAMVDLEGRWLYASPSYQRILDAADLAPGTAVYRRLHPDDAEIARLAVIRAALSHRPRDVALRLVDKEGRVRQYKTRVQALLGAPGRVLLVSRDVTDLRESEERVLLAAHALEGMTDAIVITAADGTIVTVNRAFCQLTGYKRDDVLGQSDKVIRNALQPPEFYDEVYATLLRDGYWSGTTWARRVNGAVYREWRSIRVVRNDDGTITHLVHVASEVGAQRPGMESTNPGLRG